LVGKLEQLAALETFGERQIAHWQRAKKMLQQCRYCDCRIYSGREYEEDRVG
jgi:hypothetical protein